MIKLKKFHILIAALGVFALLSLSSPAKAAPVLRMDMKQLFVEAETGTPGSYVPGFGGTTHTGRLLVADDGNTNMNLTLDSVFNIIYQTFSFPTPNYAIITIDAEMLFNNGTVAGGTFSVVLDRPDLSQDVFSASLVPSSGQITTDAGGFQISAALTSITFNNATFGGIDVAGVATTPTGTLIQFEYTPDAETFQDDNTRIKLEVSSVPAPGALVAGAPLLICMMVRYQRRRRTRLADWR